jgi:hypothetical protein
MAAQPTLLQVVPGERARRAQLVRRAKVLAWGGNAWHLVEFGIAVGAGVAASSVALVGFGIDSLISRWPPAGSWSGSSPGAGPGRHPPSGSPSA